MEAALAEERRLLVARHAADGDALDEPRVRRYAEAAGRGAHLGKDGLGNAEELKQEGIPAPLVDVVEHGPARIGHVRGVHGPVGELPNEPAVHGAEAELPRLGTGTGAGHLTQDPGELAGGEVGVGHEARARRDLGRGRRVARDGLHHGRRAAALPDDGVHDGLAGGAVPHDGGLALVGDADRIDLGGVHVRGHDELGERAQLRRENVLRVVLDPAGLRVDLGEGALDRGDGAAGAVDEHGAGRGGARIERYDVFFHVRFSSSRFLAVALRGRAAGYRSVAQTVLAGIEGVRAHLSQYRCAFDTICGTRLVSGTPHPAKLCLSCVSLSSSG